MNYYNTPFLQLVIQDLYKRLQGNLQDLTIIFPNKRAGLFANQYLSELTDKPLWAPRYTTISEFFSSLSDKKVPDTILLVAYLYKAYLATLNSKPYTLSSKLSSSFDTFYGWGEILLNDFQDIDNNLVDARQLFSNISALETLSSLDYLDPEQIKAIRTYFTDFDPDDKNQLRQRFAEMWNSMNDIYTRFRNDLASDGLAYEAMLKREVIENLDPSNDPSNDPSKSPLWRGDFPSTGQGSYPSPQEGRLGGVLLSQSYAIVGFNVLNETEKQLFQYLKTNADTYFYWDYDPRFIHDEAARFIEENIRLFPNALTDQGRSGGVQIEIVGASTDSAQSSFANQWLKQHIQSPLNTNAIVLADENMLQTVLHTLPECPLNITMGYPLRQTPIASFIQALIDLQTRGFSRKGDGTMFHAYVTPVLRHPYTLQLDHKESARIFKYMREHNTTYVRPSLFASSTLLSRIFTPVPESQILPYLIDLIKQAGIANKHADPLTIESIFTAYQLLNTLRDTLDPSKSPLWRGDFQTTDQDSCSSPFEGRLGRVILSLLNSKTIAFHGEPANGLQVMGMLETRNLDFRNLIILSANEGMLPKASHMPSFIPYFLRDVHRLTTIEKQTSLYAYYFYRLLQRADNVALVYNNYTEGLRKGEMSHFLLQLQLDQGRLGRVPYTLNSKLTYSPNTAMTRKVEYMEKTEAGLARMLDSLQYTFSPSALKTYIQCPLQFYFKYVARLREQDEISDDIEDSTFGTIIHEVMRELYEPYVGRELTSTVLQAMHKNDTAIRALVDKQFAINVFHEDGTAADPATWGGSAILNRDVIIRYIHSQLLHDAAIAPIHLIALEIDPPKSPLLRGDFPSTGQDSCSSPFKGRLGGVQGRSGGVPIFLGGRIDRIDTITAYGQSVTRIVDYKTSSHQQTLTSIANLFIPTTNSDDHIFQTFCYAEMLLTDPSKSPLWRGDFQTTGQDSCSSPSEGRLGRVLLSPSLNYIKLLGKPHYQSIVTLPSERRGGERQPVLDYREQCHEEFHAHLVDLVTEILDTRKPFTPLPFDFAQGKLKAQDKRISTGQSSPCRFCPFTTLCGKPQNEA